MNEVNCSTNANNDAKVYLLSSSWEATKNGCGKPRSSHEF